MQVGHKGYLADGQVEILNFFSGFEIATNTIANAT